MSMESVFLLIPAFFLTALVYSMAGFGGGSTYIALLLLFSFPYTVIPRISLVCNVIVVIGGCFLFYKEGYFSPRKVLPFILTSIPAAYLGGRIPIGKTLFSILLGISLTIAAIRMLLSHRDFQSNKMVSWKTAWLVGLPVGALLGGLSGLVGIGGGIFLSPLLLLLGWANAREAAAAASFFILVNSVSGLLGQLSKGGMVEDIPLLIPLALAVFVGGQIGSRLGSRRLPRLVLQRVTAFLILSVSLRLIWKSLGG